MGAQINDVAGDSNLSGVYSSGMRVQPYTPAKELGPKVLELTSVLQTTLDAEKLIDLFSNAIKNDIAVDGLRYQMVSHGIDIIVGDQPPHTCSYQLVIADFNLGEMRFFRSQRFSDEETRKLENLLCALVYPLRNALMYRDAVRSSFIDPLTGVKNRAAMDNALLREVELCRRQKASMSIILMDLDHFKFVNDRHGHAAGDTALRNVAQCTESSIRSSDMLFRFGGEEFLILLSYTRTDGALLLAERVRRQIEQLVAVPDSADIALTVSLGVSSLQENEDAKSLFDRADKALYRAKQAGRNRVMSG